MGTASPEVISSSTNGHHASAVPGREIQPFPSSLHIANSHRIENIPALELFREIPIAHRESAVVTVDAPRETSSNQGSLDRHLHRSLLEAESNVNLMKGFLLLENVVFELPDQAASQLPLPNPDSAVYPLALDAITARNKLRRMHRQVEKGLMEEGKDGVQIGSIFGVGEVVTPTEIRQHPEIGTYALNVLGINISIFEKRDEKDEQDHIINSRYRRAMRAVETPEERARINLAMKVACAYYGLVQKNFLPSNVGANKIEDPESLKPLGDKIYHKDDSPQKVKPLDGQVFLPLKWEEEPQGWKAKAKEVWNRLVLRKKPVEEIQIYHKAV